MQSVAPPEPAATARPTLHRWSVAAAAVAILVVAFGLRTYVAGLIVDANLVFGRDGGLALAQALQSLPDIAWLQTHDVDPPLYQLLLGIWVPLAGLSPFAVKFLGVLASTFGVAATYSVGRIVAGPAVGLAAAFIYAVSVMNLDISASLRPYALSAALAALSLASFVALLRTGHIIRPRESVVAGIWFLSTTAGLFTSLFFAPVAVAQVTTVAMLARWTSRRGRSPSSSICSTRTAAGLRATTAALPRAPRRPTRGRRATR